jgi:hypothetical protein
MGAKTDANYNHKNSDNQDFFNIVLDIYKKINEFSFAMIPIDWF